MPEDSDTLETTLQKLLYAFVVANQDVLASKLKPGTKILQVSIDGVPVNVPIKLAKPQKTPPTIPPPIPDP